ncbi:unnamed protein product [[Candida] boidinii]|uniref:Unnamed protein product n=1 Tax=Candida boidinii TaxID=5477 RepID=A0A9W6T2G5_CANBO|nr:unnamed protein product [[Candida] boidinii]
MTAKDNSLFVIKDATVLKQNNHPPNGFIDILTMVFSTVWGFLLALANSLLGLDILIDPKQNLQSSSNETKESNETNETTNKKETDLKDDLKEIGKDDSKETGKDETVEELSSVISSPPMSVSSSTSSVLFPQRSNFISSLTNSNSNLNECSTGPESQLFSFTNKNGELEWSLMDNNSKSSLNLDPNYHQLSPISDSSTHSPNNNKQQQPQQDQQHDTKSTNPIYGFVSLSPISSIKSTGSSHMSGNESNTTNPTTTNNSPNVSSGNDDDMSPHNDKMVSSSASEGEDDEDEKENGKSTIFKEIKKEFVSTPNSSKASDDDEEDIEGDVVTDEKGNKVHQCPYCDSKFRMRGYLTRHIKKHNSEKAYRCPYYNHDSTQKCHV